jgi:hypothetical protein
VKLPLEYKPVQGHIAAQLGTVYLADPCNNVHRNPNFCIGLNIDQGWLAAISVQGLWNQRIEVLVNYLHTPLHCKFCLFMYHKVADCPELKHSSPTNQLETPPQPQLPTPKRSYVAVTKQPQVDADGFTVVTHRSHRHKMPHNPPNTNTSNLRPIPTSQTVYEVLNQDLQVTQYQGEGELIPNQDELEEGEFRPSPSRPDFAKVIPETIPPILHRSPSFNHHPHTLESMQ